MKTFLKTLFVILFLVNNLYTQVGIGNTAPKATLDIQASNQATPTSQDGLLIPRIDSFPITNPTEDQDGMLIFIHQRIFFIFGKTLKLNGFHYMEKILRL